MLALPLSDGGFGDRPEEARRRREVIVLRAEELLQARYVAAGRRVGVVNAHAVGDDDTSGCARRRAGGVLGVARPQSGLQLYDDLLELRHLGEERRYFGLYTTRGLCRNEEGGGE